MPSGVELSQMAVTIFCKIAVEHQALNCPFPGVFAPCFRKAFNHVAVFVDDILIAERT
ncbi:MAG: hypothetical protein LUE20_05205 [Oscillospiraceae bacterium]|nr:hypothetical protein [Oscillospiraceae bacterium]